MAKEYAYKRWFVKPHKLNSCLQDVFNELLDVITAKQDELNRHP
jgi:hypothetical protein